MLSSKECEGVINDSFFQLFWRKILGVGEDPSPIESVTRLSARLVAFITHSPEVLGLGSPILLHFVGEWHEEVRDHQRVQAFTYLHCRVAVECHFAIK